MTTEEIKVQVIDLKTRYNSWTPNDKANIRKIVKELKIKHRFNSKCNSCYSDAFHLIINTLGMTSADFVIPKVASKVYLFLGESPLNWHGPYGNVVMDEYTQEEIIEKFIETFPNQQQYVVKDEVLEMPDAEVNDEELLLL